MKNAARILVEEPIRDIQDLFRIILEPVSSRIDFARDVPEALEYAAENDYDIVFLDVGVPELEGIDGAEELNDRFPEMAVVLTCSIKLSPHLAARFLSHATNFLVSKPFDILEVRQLVEHLYETRRSRSRIIPLLGEDRADSLATAM